jgi:hypothetical protein
MLILLLFLVLCKIGVLDLGLLNLNSSHISILNRYVLENYFLINLLFLIYIPSMFFIFLRWFYVCTYLYKLYLLKRNVISNIKSPVYDYFPNETRDGFFRFYRTHIEMSVFNFFHNLFYKNSDSKSNRIKKALLYASDNIIL